MRVLLVEPPINSFTGFKKRGFPLGLCSLGTVLAEETGSYVRVLDADKIIDFSENVDFTNQRKRITTFLEGVNDLDNVVWKEIRRRIEAFKPDVVGITTMTLQYASALRVAQLVKEINRDCLVLVGGAHANVMPELIVQWPSIDAAVKGEGEHALCAIVKNHAARKSLDGIPGVLTRQNAGPSYFPPLEVEDLDALPVPDRALLLDAEKYSSEDLGLIMTSRGCPYKCAYCSNFTRKVRYRSVEKVIEEIRQVSTTYGTRQFLIKDDSFTLKKLRVKEFSQALLDNAINIYWECTTRLDLIDDDLLSSMKKSGCNRVAVGIESGDDKILELINKKLNKEQIREKVQVLKRSGIFWTGYFLIGMPIETKESVYDTLKFMKELDPPYAAVGVYKPYPGTKLYEKAKSLDLITHDVDNDYFFRTSPVDYFIRDPRQRSIYIDLQEYDALVRSIEHEFEQHNKRVGKLVGRFISRFHVYKNDRALLLRDAKLGMKWLVQGIGR